jgi:hypothetical protein
MSGFFEELQRRKVYRVAVAYVVAAGFLIQIASAAFPAWELPNWSVRLVIVLLLIGFPIALVLAWAYDITPQGIQGTPTRGIHRRRNLILLIVAAVIISAFAGFFLLPRAVWQKVDKSGQRLFRRWHPGRSPDASRQDRGFESDFAHFDSGTSKRSG